MCVVNVLCLRECFRSVGLCKFMSWVFVTVVEETVETRKRQRDTEA